MRAGSCRPSRPGSSPSSPTAWAITCWTDGGRAQGKLASPARRQSPMRLGAIRRLSRALISLMPGSMILSEKSATFRDHALLLRPALEQTVRDQACGAPAPRVVGAHAQAAVLAGHDGASPGIADLEAHRVFGAADPSHHAEEGLLGAEIEGNPGVAAIAVVQRTRLCGGGIRAPDLDQLVAPRLREQLADLFGDLRELRRIGLAGGRHGSAGVL